MIEIMKLFDLCKKSKGMRKKYYILHFSQRTLRSGANTPN